MASGSASIKSGLPAPATTSKIPTVRSDLQKFIGPLDVQEDKHQLRCLLPECTQKFAYNSHTGWGNCIGHLVKVHKMDPEKFKHRTIVSGSGPMDMFLNQTGLGYTENKNCYEINDPKQRVFERDVMDLVAIAGVPLQLTDHPMFMKTVKHLDSKIRRVSRRTLGRRFQAEDTKIKKEQASKIEKLQDGHLHVTFDLWSSSSHKAVLGTKIHYIEDWKLISFVIGFRHFKDRKDAASIRENICSLMKSYRIHPSQVGIIMADNASENVKAFNMVSVIDKVPPNAQDYGNQLIGQDDEGDVADNAIGGLENGAFPEDFNVIAENEEDAITDANLETVLHEFEDWSKWNFTRLGCIAHALQLVINECLRKNSHAKEICNKISDLLAFFNRSNYWNNKLVESAKISLVKPGTTRWNSTLYALQRITKPGYLEKLNNVLIDATNNAKTKTQKKAIPETIRTDTLDDMDELSNILSSLEEFTQKVQGDMVTSSLVIPGLISIYKAVATIECNSEAIKEFQESICKGVTERFAANVQDSYSGKGAKKQLLKVFSSQPYILAAILDPRIKATPFTVKLREPFGLDQYIPSKEAVITILKDDLRSDYRQVEGAAECSTADSVTEGAPPAKKNRDIIFDLIDETYTHEPSTEEDLNTEVLRYINSPIIPKKDDPLKWWSVNEALFPNLAKMAKKYLSFPATTGAVERVFSIAGSIDRYRRSRLTMETLESLLQYRETRLAQLRAPQESSTNT